MLTQNWRDELDDNDRAEYEAWLDSLAADSDRQRQLDDEQADEAESEAA